MKAATPGKLAMPATLPLLFVADSDFTSCAMALYLISQTRMRSALIDMERSSTFQRTRRVADKHGVVKVTVWINPESIRVVERFWVILSIDFDCRSAQCHKGVFEDLFIVLDVLRYFNGVIPAQQILTKRIGIAEILVKVKIVNVMQEATDVSCDIKASALLLAAGERLQYFTRKACGIFLCSGAPGRRHRGTLC